MKNSIKNKMEKIMNSVEKVDSFLMTDHLDLRDSDHFQRRESKVIFFLKKEEIENCVLDLAKTQGMLLYEDSNIRMARVLFGRFDLLVGESLIKFEIAINVQDMALDYRYICTDMNHKRESILEGEAILTKILASLVSKPMKLISVLPLDTLITYHG